MPNTQPAVDAIKASLANTRVAYSRVERRSIGCMVACALSKLACIAGAIPQRVKSNGLYGCHAFTLEVDGDDTRYRVIVAPLDAPVEIGGVPADEHFGG